MKTYLIAACMALMSMMSFAAKPVADTTAVSSARVTVNGMVCAFCAQGIEKRLSSMPATQTVWVDLKKRVVLVQAKAGKPLDQKAITEEIVEAGYDVVSFELVAQTVDALKATPQVTP